MEFTNPTTKEQMFSTLQDIFYYYRIRREAWEDVELQPLKLNKLEFNRSTQEEILERAEKLVCADVSQKKHQSVQQLILAKTELTCKTVSLAQQIQETENAIIALYDKQVEELKKQLSKLGTANSTIESSEINKIRIACTNIRDNAIFETLLSTGCRVSEIANLKLEDIDMENNMAKIKGKGDKERIVFLSARAIEFLKIYIQQSKRSDNYVFVSNHRPYSGLSNKSLERIIRKMSDSANINKAVFPHLLRHTFATNAINKGMPISSLCDLMGHSSIDTTRIYAKNSNTKLKYDYEMHI
jgi:site-specific recombinase XerD